MITAAYFAGNERCTGIHCLVGAKIGPATTLGQRWTQVSACRLGLGSHQLSTIFCLLQLFGPLTLAQTDPHSGTSAGNNLPESLS